MHTRDGGKPNLKDLPYSPPMGPKGMSNNSVGLGGTNYGCCGTQGKHSLDATTSGSPGNGGANHGNSPTQRG
jgi:hypothetical protein